VISRLKLMRNTMSCRWKRLNLLFSSNKENEDV
jgi:hypothetical protein